MTLQPEERPDSASPIDRLRPERANGYEQYRIVQRSGSPQYAEFSVPIDGTRAPARVCIGYRRCCEFDEGNQPGQDYAVVRAGGGYVVGVVADGVSRSFYGNLAAEYVATLLVDELWRRRADTPNSEVMACRLKEAEAKFADYVKEYRIPENLSPYLIPILERKRQKGSQAVFAVFVLHVAKGHLTMYQVGDISALVHNSGSEPMMVESSAKGRWSSAGASALLLKRTSVKNVEGVVIKSDGVSKEWGQTLDGDALAPHQFSLMAKTRAPLDDICFIAVRLNPVSAVAALTRRAASEPRAEESPSAAEPEQPVPTGQTVPTVPTNEQTVLTDKQTHTSKQRLPVSDDAGGSAEAATTEGEVEKISADTNLPVQGEKGEGQTREGAGLKRAARPEARAPWREIGIFGAGVLVGLAAGVAITLLVVFAVTRLRSAPADAPPDAKNLPAPQASPGAQTTHTPERADISVEAKWVEQTTFLSEHKAPLPKLISNNPTTSPGEVIVHVSADADEIERVVLVLNGKEAEAERGHDEGGRLSFFARLRGFAGPSPVTIRVLGREGKALYEGQQEMRGRDNKDPANKDPFLGYYEISVRHGG